MYHSYDFVILTADTVIHNTLFVPKNDARFMPLAKISNIEIVPSLLCLFIPIHCPSPPKNEFFVSQEIHIHVVVKKCPEIDNFNI